MPTLLKWYNFPHTTDIRFKVRFSEDEDVYLEAETRIRLVQNFSIMEPKGDVILHKCLPSKEAILNPSLENISFWDR